jgi:glycosyltransferase XagB
MPGPCRVLAGSAMQPQTPWMLSQAPTDSLRTDEAAAVRWRPDDLSGEAPGDFRHVASEIAFLAHHGVPVEVLAAATRRGSLLGVAPEDILIREGHCSEEFFYRSLADELGLGFRTTFTVLRAPSSSMLSRCELAEIDSDAGCDFVIAPRGKLIGNLLGARGRALAETHRIAVTTPTRLSRAILHRSGRAVASAAAAAPLGDAGRWSAKAFPHRNQQAGFAGLAGAILTMAWISPDAAWLLASGVLALSFVLQGGLRAASLLAGSRPVPKRPPQLPDSALPRYTVLVPLYREGRVLRRLVQALADLDYPAGKLEIKILVEADDQETWREAQRLALQPPFEVVICPPGLPRTKPRALNIGLGLGHGELLVVYDAEDRPDRNQLRLAAARFAASPPRVACLQASLAIDNADESWLTRHFALEYAQLFDVTVPGMASLSLPIPLGGTSNHFRVEALLAAGAWDAWNVTEDADLGLRLARLGYRVGKLESTTWEEAPVTLRPWLRQRTRWLKGWMRPVKIENSAAISTSMAPAGKSHQPSSNNFFATQRTPSHMSDPLSQFWPSAEFPLGDMPPHWSISVLPLLEAARGALLPVPVVGFAMEPNFHEGDVAIVDRGWTVPSREGVYALWERGGDGIAIRRVQPLAGKAGEAIISCDRDRHPVPRDDLAERVFISDVRWIGRVVGQLKKIY